MGFGGRGQKTGKSPSVMGLRTTTNLRRITSRENEDLCYSSLSFLWCAGHNGGTKDGQVVVRHTSHSVRRASRYIYVRMTYKMNTFS